MKRYLAYGAVIVAVALTWSARAEAAQRWLCGDAAAWQVTIYQEDGPEAEGLLEAPESDGTPLRCTAQGEGLGTEWVCAAEAAQAQAWTVEVRRGHRALDPWALATVRLQDSVVAQRLPCTVETVHGGNMRGDNAYEVQQGRS